MKKLIEKVRDLNLNNIPIVVIANKIDQCTKRQVSKSDAEDLSSDYHVRVFERSAAIPTDEIGRVFVEIHRMIQVKKKQRRDSDPYIFSTALNRMDLKTIARKSSSLDADDFIKLVVK